MFFETTLTSERIASMDGSGAWAGELLDDIVASVLGIKLVGEGYGMLIGKDGQVLVHRDGERVTKPSTDLAPALKPEFLAELATSGEMREIELGMPVF